MPIHWGKLLVSVVICELAGVIGGLFTRSSIPTWYATLQKPSFNPPGWIFGPVWTILYLLMGISLYLVWQSAADPRLKSLALIAFGVQLLLNALWSVIFFGLRAPAFALADLGLLWASILVTILLFWRISPVAGGILIPYIVWVSFAAILNAAIVVLNRR
jgi:translocator protein